MSEGAIVRGILDWLQLSGIVAWRNNTGAAKSPDGKRFIRFGEPGSPDIIGCLPDGRLLAIECKTPKGRLSSTQVAFLARLAASGALAIVARSLDDVIEAIRGNA